MPNRPLYSTRSSCTPLLVEVDEQVVDLGTLAIHDLASENVLLQGRR